MLRICWPFHADQPHNAVNLSEVHDVGYELIEVRTGKGLLPRYRTGKAPLGTLDSIRDEARQVLDSAFGTEGARKREIMKKLQRKVLSSWDKDGAATKELGRMLDALCA